ncbi:unnamed protein product [Ciceribacter sp. T2.26MG-112.2]|uniref:RNA-directed DNA polymerase n=1 Tax=Ciceribacter sp. T2.26MG-112.2 TaxID=3137154 RepID=UPI000E159DBC|nr:RNA-directed DNA polymerase [Ciceribacter naphthalenivorans]SSC71452.1 unnamed protein product [Ciceribacter naphthalenivorans]
MAAVQPSAELFATKGLLPENLPPVFTTRNLWAHLAPIGGAYGVVAKVVGEAATYNASKRGGQRRIFGVPHPAFIRDAGLFYEKHWPSLLPQVEASSGSVSKPIFQIAGNRHVRITPHSELPRIRLRAFSRFKYCLITDVARFFPSIYTHSFPWAINGKREAKTDSSPQSSAVFGNRLDFILRNSQSRQTVGIAVGPDTSKVASELLMAAVDRAFVRRSGRARPTYVRHVDDYWIAGNTYEECEKHLQNLRASLREFELDINEGKTKIVSMREVFADDWPFEFDKEIIASLEPGSNPNEALGVLTSMIERATTTNDDGLIRHAIRVIDERRLWSRDWDLLQHFLAQCAVQFPHTTDYVARVVAWRHRIYPKQVDVGLWNEVATLTVTQNASLGRDSEAIWALWLIKELGAKVPRTTSDLMLSNSGSLVLAWLAHMHAKRMTTDRRLWSKLREVVADNPLAGSAWPLSLELIHLEKGDAAWIDGSLPLAMRILHEQKASIIEWSARPRVFDEPDDDDDMPDFAIEDYGADYGGSEADEDEEDLPERPDFDDLF